MSSVFSYLLAPFPNLRILQPNIQVPAPEPGFPLFLSRVTATGEGEMANLRSYLISRRCCGTTDVDIKKETDEFLKGYYGAAADIKEYINLVHDNNQSGRSVKMSIFGSPIDDKETFLSDSLIARTTKFSTGS